MTASVVLKPLSKLSPAEEAAWNAFRHGDRVLASPYFALGYLRAMETARPGIEVLCWHDGDTPTGFLPLRRAALGLARPVGGPMDDLHGLIAPADHSLDICEAMRSVGLGGYAFSASPYTQVRHGLKGHCGEGNHIIDLSAGPDTYFAQRGAASRSFKRLRSKARRLIEDPSVEVRHDTQDPAAFGRMIELKQLAFAEAGYFDLFSLDWPRKALEAIAASDAPEARGVLSTLHMDGRLAAVTFNMRSEDVLHYWFPAYEPDLADSQAGNALLFSLVDWAAAEGIHEIHLGLGAAQYKVMMGSYAMPVRIGETTVGGSAKLFSTFAEKARDLEDQGGFALPAKLVRKFDRVCLAGTLRA